MFQTHGGKKFSPYSPSITVKPLMALPTFSLAHTLQETDTIQDNLHAEEDECHLHKLDDVLLLDGMGIDDMVEHPLNGILGIDNILPEIPMPLCPPKHNVPLPAEIICHRHAK